MKIDRARFLALTASIGVGAASCGRTEVAIAPVPVPPPATATPEPVADAAPPVASVEPPPPKPPPAPACPENAIGSLAACDTWKVDPTCESGGPRRECTSLLDMQSSAPRSDGEPEGFQPRVAQAIASCMTKKPVTRVTGCKLPDMHKCIREGVDTVCIEPEMTARCEKLIHACQARHARVTFTAEQCAKIATATRGELRSWALEAMSGLDAHGSPTAEGCTLQYVTIYQPWPANWWTGK